MNIRSQRRTRRARRTRRTKRTKRAGRTRRTRRTKRAGRTRKTKRIKRAGRTKKTKRSRRVIYQSAGASTQNLEDKAYKAKQVMGKNLTNQKIWENAVRNSPRFMRQGGPHQALIDHNLLIEANLRGASLPGGQDQKWHEKLEIIRALVKTEKEAAAQQDDIPLESQERHIEEVKPMGERVSKAFRAVGAGAADFLGSGAPGSGVSGPRYDKLLRDIKMPHWRRLPTTAEIQGLDPSNKNVRYRS
jgi:hypothetical protein